LCLIVWLACCLLMFGGCDLKKPANLQRACARDMLVAEAVHQPTADTALVNMSECSPLRSFNHLPAILHYAVVHPGWRHPLRHWGASLRSRTRRMSATAAAAGTRRSTSAANRTRSGPGQQSKSSSQQAAVKKQQS